MSDKSTKEPILGPSDAVIEEFLSRVRLDETLSATVEEGLKELVKADRLADSPAIAEKIIGAVRANDETYKP